MGRWGSGLRAAIDLKLTFFFCGSDRHLITSEYATVEAKKGSRLSGKEFVLPALANDRFPQKHSLWGGSN